MGEGESSQCVHVVNIVGIQHAIAQGATSVADLEEKSWPQKVGYVKDVDGNIVRLGSFPAM